MKPSGSVTHLIQQMKDGDSQAATKLWERYFRRLAGLARKRLNAQFVRDADAEDAALSAFVSFWSGLQADQFDDLHNRENLWRLLVVITARKASDYRTREGRLKRGAGRVVSEAGIPGKQTIEDIVGGAPTPAFEAASREWLDRLLDQLGDDVLREVAVMKLHGWKNAEIAQARKCGIRTVERYLKAIRIKWSAELVEHD